VNSRQLPIYALALAILIVGLAAVGVPLGRVFFVLLVLACPLMMLVMMRGMGNRDEQGRKDRQDDPSGHRHDQRPASGRR
jgi:Flp pilus assembly protein TadB